LRDSLLGQLSFIVDKAVSTSLQTHFQILQESKLATSFHFEICVDEMTCKYNVGSGKFQTIDGTSMGGNVGLMSTGTSLVVQICLQIEQ